MRAGVRASRRALGAALALSLSLLAARVEAQQPGPPGGGRPPRAERAQRAQLEQRARQAYGRALRDRLGLTQDQVGKLQALNRRLAPGRQQLMQEERATRRELAQQVRRDSLADQARVSALLDQLDKLQRRRLDLVEQEDRGLAEFLSPVQRAKFRALQELVRGRMEPARRGMPRGAGDSARR